MRRNQTTRRRDGLERPASLKKQEDRVARHRERAESMVASEPLQLEQTLIEFGRQHDVLDVQRCLDYPVDLHRLTFIAAAIAPQSARTILKIAPPVPRYALPR